MRHARDVCGCRYLRENHNSILGVREYALKEGGAYLVRTAPRMHANAAIMSHHITSQDITSHHAA